MESLYGVPGGSDMKVSEELGPRFDPPLTPLGEKSERRVFIGLIGPRASGKTKLQKMLMEHEGMKSPKNIVTRPARPDDIRTEVVTHDEFHRLWKRNMLVGVTEKAGDGHIRGILTPFPPGVSVRPITRDGMQVIRHSGVVDRCVSVLVMPPSYREWIRRIEGRRDLGFLTKKDVSEMAKVTALEEGDNVFVFPRVNTDGMGEFDTIVTELGVTKAFFRMLKENGCRVKRKT